MIDPERPPRPRSVELRHCESLVETGATRLQRCTALTTARGRLRRPVFGALLVVAGCREAQDTAPHTSAQVAAARPAEAPVTDVPEPGAAATLNVTPGTNAAAPMLERNPDASDLSTRKRLPDIPEGCTVELSMSPVVPYDLNFIKYTDDFQTFVDLAKKEHSEISIISSYEDFDNLTQKRWSRKEMRNGSELCYIRTS